MKKIDGHNFNVRIFHNISEFDEAMTLPIVDGRNTASDAPDNGFRGTEDFLHAERLRRFGDEKSSKAIFGIINQFTKKTHKNEFEHIIENRMVGHSPIVPNVLAGQPNAMLYTEYKRIPNQQVTMIVDSSFSRLFTQEQISTYGATLLSLVDKLESEGIRVELYISSSYTSFKPIIEEKVINKVAFYGLDDQKQILINNLKSIFDKSVKPKKHTYIRKKIKKIEHANLEDISEKKLSYDKRHLYCNIIKIKEFSDPLNIYKLAYYMVNPSFLRRHANRLLEVYPDVFDDTPAKYSYGLTGEGTFVKAEQVYKNIFENAIYFNNFISPYFEKENINTYINDAFARIKREVLDLEKKEKYGLVD